MNENNIFNINIGPDTARELALREAGLSGAQFDSVRIDGGYWELEFTDGTMDYTCYIDATDGSVPGFSFVPTAEIDLSVEGAGTVRTQGAA